MKKYAVTFVQYHTYRVEANNEEKAVELAEDLFDSDMRRPVAACWYDDVEIEQCENADE